MGNERRRPFRRIKRLYYYGVLLFLLFSIFLLYRNARTFLCTSGDLKQILESLCERVENVVANGDMCQLLCSDNPAIIPDGCESLHGGKEIVFSAMKRPWDEKVFVKSRKTNPDPEESFVKVFRLDSFPPPETFFKMIQTFVKDNYGIDIFELEEIWSDGRELEFLTPEEMENAWTLVQDNEYVLTRYFSKTELFPDLYGTCGSFYIVESLEPLSVPSYFTSDFQDLVQGAKAAFLILDYLEDLNDKVKDSWYLCDMKISHFGVSSSTGKVKFLDLDSVFPKSILDKSIGDGSPCSKDEDCAYFDCKGKCGKTGTCDSGVINDNLSIVCEKIFLDSFIFSGLIKSRNKHTSKSIKRLLKECGTADSSVLLPKFKTAFDEVLRFDAALKEEDEKEF